MVGENPHSAWFIPIPSGINLGQLENSPVSFSSTILQFIPAIPKKTRVGRFPPAHDTQEEQEGPGGEGEGASNSVYSLANVYINHITMENPPYSIKSPF